MDRAVAARARSGAPGRATARLLARGEGWSVSDVLCTSGPGDRTFEEQHAGVSLGVVVAGTFEYRSAHGRELMTAGSVLLGNPGQCFECSHRHAAGDRCIAVRLAPDYFHRLAADVGGRVGDRGFRRSRLAPDRRSARVVALAAAGVAARVLPSWEEIALEVAATVVRLADDTAPDPPGSPPAAVARVTESVRAIQAHPDAPFTLVRLAADAGQSPYHYLRTFRRLTGVTPHQFVLRARLREAAARVLATDEHVAAAAFESGFGDVSNFNRLFRGEFGLAPRAFRRRFGGRRA